MNNIPGYKLKKNNIFNYRQREWDDSLMILNIQDMLKCGEKYNILTKKVAFNNKKKKKNEKTEIKKTISKMLNIVVHLKGRVKPIELNYEVPWLVENYFYIGGNKKIPVFQLFDKPVIYRNNVVKIRTNIQTMNMTINENNKSGYFISLNIFNKKIPFARVLLAYLGKTELKKRFIDAKQSTSKNWALLIRDIETVLMDTTIDPKKIISSYFRGKNDKEIVANILLITDIDIFSKKFMDTENLFEEFIHSINVMDSEKKEDVLRKDDCSLSNKRIRFLEYILYSHLCKDFYNMITTLKKPKRDKFSNNSKVILANANTSPIVQYENPINPLDELSRLSRVALTGPGGFKKKNIPTYLRDIHSSLPGRICPVDTGDRENCGSLQYLVPTSEINDNGTFGNASEKVRASTTISHVPFLEHNDSTRLQMASSQMKHSIMLKEFDIPYVQSGVEGLYTDKTSFVFVAERSGKVIYKDVDIIIVQYDSKKCQAFNIGYKKARLSIVDFYKTYYDVGDRFKKGDIIVESNFLNNGIATIGRNLRTAIMTWHGYNFEDAIVISQKVADENKLTSVHYLDLSFEISPDKILLNLGDTSDYKPLPSIGQRLHKGEVYAKIKTMSNKAEDNHDVILDDANTRTVTEECTITNVEVFVNKMNEIEPEYCNYVNGIVKNQKVNKKNLIATLKNHLTQEQMDHFLASLEIDESSKEDKFKMKGELIDGILINITAIYERPICVGDKIGNRHGNKGIISAIIPENLMPVSSDGNPAEVIINPLGIISRMNVGQVYELHMTEALQKMKAAIELKFKNGESKKDIYNYFMKFMKIVDKTENQNVCLNWEAVLEKTELSDFMDNLDDIGIIQPPFETVKLEDTKAALEYSGAQFEYECYEPIKKEHTKQPVAFGYMYFCKLNHIAQDKMAVRGIGPYASKTSQPLHGKIRKGGQRIGEMENWAFGGHGATHNLNELLTTKSDSIMKRDKYISDMIQNGDLLVNKDEDPVSQSIRLLQCSLKTMGLDYPILEDEE